jgi:putative ABC transport system permease protein
MFLYDLRLAVRRLVHEPGFTLAAVLTLALGVGANVAVFTVVEAVLLRPLPYPDAGRLVLLKHRDIRTGLTKEYLGLGDYIDITEQQTTFSAIGAYGTAQGTVFESDNPYRVSALLATSGALQALQLRPFLGRSLEPEDSRPGAQPVMLLGYELWKSRYAGDSSIIGRSLRVDEKDRLVVGIAPPAFRFPPTYATDVVASIEIPSQTPAQRVSGWIPAVGRLAAGRQLPEATAELLALSNQFREAYPATNQAASYFAVSLHDALVGSTKSALVLLLAAVTVVLLIACVNVANLLVARSLARKREMAVRIALGAGRRRLAAQLLTESLVLALAAGLVGLVIARFGAPALVALVPRSVDIPGLDTAGLDGSVLAFGFGITLLTALGFSGLSLLTVRFETAAADLVGAGRTSMSRLARRAMAGLVVAEIAFAVMLLVGAGLILRSFAGLLAVDPGFRFDNVLTLDVSLPGGRYAAPPAREAFFRGAFAALAARPEVREVGAAVVMPLTGNNWTVPFQRADQPLPPGQQPPDVGWQQASGGFFRALRIPLRRGRLFDERDTPTSPPVVIVSDALEKRFFGDESAVGQRIRLGPQTLEIVGVVGSIRRAALSDEPRADMYFPFERSPGMGSTLFVRTAGDPEQSLATLQRVLREQEPNLAFGDSRTLAQVAEESVRVTRLLLWLLGAFAVTALLLAAVGIYAVMAYVVRQQTREIGTRMALGALRADILRLVLGQGARIAALGTGLGLAIGLGAARTLRSVLYGVSAADPYILAFAALVLAATTMAACYLPARRAASVDPARTLTEQ